MMFGLSGASVSGSNKYSGYVNRAGEAEQISPPLLYAIAWRESISGEMNGEWPDAATVLSEDGGHGLFQLTSSWPDDWQDPVANATYAARVFVKPAIDYWHGLQRYQGYDLVRLVAATFNAGLGNAIAGHDAGDVDKFTTDGYAAAVLGFYQNLTTKGVPT